MVTCHYAVGHSKAQKKHVNTYTRRAALAAHQRSHSSAQRFMTGKNFFMQGHSLFEGLWGNKTQQFS
jgi:hypothetical protein